MQGWCSVMRSLYVPMLRNFRSRHPLSRPFDFLLYTKLETPSVGLVTNRLKNRKWARDQIHKWHYSCWEQNQLTVIYHLRQNYSMGEGLCLTYQMLCQVSSIFPHGDVSSIVSVLAQLVSPFVCRDMEDSFQGADPSKSVRVLPEQIFLTVDGLFWEVFVFTSQFMTTELRALHAGRPMIAGPGVSAT